MKVSVVIPTFNRRRLLEKCLTCLIHQDFDPASFEILIVDDENSSKTKEKVSELSQKYKRHQMTYVNTGPSHGPAAARNCGWKKAQGEIIAFTDDDCMPSSQWLSSALVVFDDNTDAIWGKVLVPLPQNPTDYQLNVAGLGKGEFVTANCFCRKSVLEKIGGFDERFYKAWREDSDLYFTLLEHQARIKFVPEAFVIHPAFKSEFGKSIWMQKNNLFEPLLYRKHPVLYQKHINFPILRTFYTINALLLGILISLAAHLWALSLVLFLLWASLTLLFVRKRLVNSSQEPRHILEMIVTSILIPPLAIYWRMVGNLKFKNV
jgi:glycosyltransferase involved in cell wall biosynthesis